jgi:hypothetical protein
MAFIEDPPCIGVARVPLDALQFSEREQNNAVHRDDEYVEDRNDPANWISALVDPEEYASLRQATFNSTDRYPLLPLSRVECLNGFYKVEAARRQMMPHDSWWTVKLFSRSKSACQ